MGGLGTARDPVPTAGPIHLATGLRYAAGARPSAAPLPAATPAAEKPSGSPTTRTSRCGNGIEIPCSLNSRRILRFTVERTPDVPFAES